MPEFQTVGNSACFKINDAAVRLDVNFSGRWSASEFQKGRFLLEEKRACSTIPVSNQKTLVKQGMECMTQGKQVAKQECPRPGGTQWLLPCGDKLQLQ